jgi:hypothetical protein
MRYTTEQIHRSLKKLSPETKKIVGSLELSDLIKNLMEKHNLRVDEAGILGDEINFVLVGLSPASELVNNLSSQLKLPEKTVLSIATDVNEQLFKKIRESFKKLDSKKTETVKNFTPVERQQVAQHNPQKQHELQRKPFVPEKPKGSRSEQLIHEIEKPKQDEKNVERAQEQQEIHHTPLSGEKVQKVEQLQPSPNKTSMEKNENTKNLQGTDEEKKEPYSTDPYQEPIEPSDKEQ